jgi:hypothetical protein
MPFPWTQWTQWTEISDNPLPLFYPTGFPYFSVHCVHEIIELVPRLALHVALLSVDAIFRDTLLYTIQVGYGGGCDAGGGLGGVWVSNDMHRHVGP